MDWLALAALVIAAASLAIGVINTAWALRRDLVRIRASTDWLGAGFSSNPTLVVEVVNLSYLAVTIVDIGFFWRDDKSRTLLHFDDKDVLAAGSIPFRLEARGVITFSDSLGTLLPALEGSKSRLAVKVATACGVVEVVDVPVNFWARRFPV